MTMSLVGRMRSSSADRPGRTMVGGKALVLLMAFHGARALSFPSLLQGAAIIPDGTFGSASHEGAVNDRLLRHDEHEMLRSMEYSLQSDIRQMARIVWEQQAATRSEASGSNSHNAEPQSNRFLQSSPYMDSASLQPVCEALQNNFVARQGSNVTSSPVNCVCTGSTTSSFSISCEFEEPLCSPLGTVCGRPFIGMSVEDFSLFSVTACVRDYQRRGSALNDTCISMEVCPDAYAEGQRALSGPNNSTTTSTNMASVQFCGCTAQYGTKVCPTCHVCDSGHGIFMDCSVYNAEVVTPSCRNPDADLDFSGATGSVVGFVPNLNGMCTQIEGGLQNRVECDCGDAGGGNFDLICQLADGFCTPHEEGSDLQYVYCGSMTSTVRFQKGVMASVTSCSDFTEPADLLATCVSFAIDPVTDEWGNCSATYGGEQCRSCNLCQGGVVKDGVVQKRTGVVLDCTNVGPGWAKVSSCQPIESTMSALEFVPRFVNVPLTKISLGEGGSTSSGVTSGLAPFVALLVASVAVATGLL